MSIMINKDAGADVFIDWCHGFNTSEFDVRKAELTERGLKIEVRKKEKKMNKNEDLKNVDTIIITRDGNTVYLNAYDKSSGLGDPVVCHKTIAECSPDDIFDFNIGAKLAFDRLYEGYDMTPKQKRKLYTGLIYIEKYPGAVLKDKSIYRVKNGIIQNCRFGVRPFIYEGMSDEELSAEIDDVVYGKNAVNFFLTPGEENKYPLTSAYFINNDQT